MHEGFDRIDDVRLPPLDVGGASRLGHLLLQAVPDSASPAVERTAAALQQAVEALDEALERSGRLASSIDPGPFEYRLERVWTAVRDRLATHAALPDDSPSRQTAADLRHRLFGDGLESSSSLGGFGPAGFGPIEAERRWAILQGEGVSERLEALVGSVFVEELRAAHAAHGDALAESAAAAAELGEPLGAVRLAISDYASELVRLASADEGQASVVRRALDPIERVRRGTAGRARSDTAIAPEREDAWADAPVPSEPEGAS